MAKHHYDKLFVSCLHPVYFDPADPHALRAAVDQLRREDQTGFTSIIVEAPVQAGPYLLRAPVALYLKDVKGKTPADVWALADLEVDRQIAYFERRGNGGFAP